MSSDSLTNDLTYTIELSGSKGVPYFLLISEKLDVIDIIFDSVKAAKQYAESKGLPLRECHAG